VREVRIPHARGATLEVAHDLVATVRRHRLTTHATALGFRVLTSLVPLVVLGIGLLRAVGLESVWPDSISPTLHRHLASSAARGVVERNGMPLHDWLVASLLFGVWSTSIASSKTGVGTLTAFLVLTAYTLVVAYVFVLGAELDETLRRRRERP